MVGLMQFTICIAYTRSARLASYDRFEPLADAGAKVGGGKWLARGARAYRGSGRSPSGVQGQSPCWGQGRSS
jgi:hypothetical protein